jgi:dolichol kinase
MIPSPDAESVPDRPPSIHPDLRDVVAPTVGLQPWRRVFHAASGLVVVFVPAFMGWSRGTTIALLISALLVQLAFDVVRLRSVRVNRVFFRLMSGLASPREARGLASSTWYTLGALVAFSLYSPSIAAGAILLLALADPAAAVVGRLAGRRPLGKGTLEGTATFWVVGSGVLVPFVGVPHAVFAALVAGVAEILPGLVDDNLVIPVVAGAVLVFTGAPALLVGFPF